MQLLVAEYKMGLPQAGWRWESNEGYLEFLGSGCLEGIPAGQAPRTAAGKSRVSAHLPHSCPALC